MNRTDYLTQQWEAYPLLEGTVLTPREAQLPLAEGSWVMGRWVPAEQGLYLEGEVFPLEPEGEFTGFSKDLWQEGDWLAVSFGPGEDPVRKAVLLAPCEGPPRFPQSLNLAHAFAEFRAQVQTFFRGQGFWQVDTPSLVFCPGTEVYVDPFKVQGRGKESFYLPTSPEIHLKKAIAQGRSRVFEIAKVFRSEDASELHRPEFWMLEWYRVQAPLSLLVRDFMQLLERLDPSWKGGLEEVTMAELFQKHLQVHLTPETSKGDLKAWCDLKGVHHRPDDTFSDLFHRLFLTFVEPALAGDKVFAVRDYPPSLAAYARLTKAGWADRQEIYWRGMELANGFFEICSPKEQLARMAQDNEAKKKRGVQPVGLDPDFYLHLQQGFPAGAGMALGLDRLFMALKGVQDINELRAF